MDELTREVRISIHAPRVGSDFFTVGIKISPIYFNPRSPCGERHQVKADLAAGKLFQSTLPVWGATRKALSGSQGISISIHAPRVGSDPRDCPTAARCGISIHAPRVGSDVTFRDGQQCLFYFNPRSPCGERRPNNWDNVQAYSISIHAPRVGSDKQDHAHPGREGDFNPRSPCGERLLVRHRSFRERRFQSTLPVWGATESGRMGGVRFTISIHAPRVGSDGARDFG